MSKTSSGGRRRTSEEPFFEASEGRRDVSHVTQHRIQTTTTIHQHAIRTMRWAVASAGCLLSLGLQPLIVDALSQHRKTARVCRNKHCSRQAPELLETVSTLLGPLASVEACDCLGHCEKGPNVELQDANGVVTTLHEMKNVATASAQLQLSLDGLSIPKLLMAAAKVMETASSLQDAKEKERLLNSVIDKLEQSDTLDVAHALARAHALRARVHIQLQQWELAIADAQKVLLEKHGLRRQASDASISLAYRAWADGEQQVGQSNQSDDFHGQKRTLAVLQDWQDAQPLFRTKIQREMKALLDMKP